MVFNSVLHQIKSKAIELRGGPLSFRTEGGITKKTTSAARSVECNREREAMRQNNLALSINQELISSCTRFFPPKRKFMHNLKVEKKSIAYPLKK